MSLGPFPCDWEARPLGGEWRGCWSSKLLPRGCPGPCGAAHSPASSAACWAVSRTAPCGRCCVCWVDDCPLEDVSALLLLPFPSQGLCLESTTLTVSGLRGAPSFTFSVRLAHRGLYTRLILVSSHIVVPFILWIK